MACSLLACCVVRVGGGSSGHCCPSVVVRLVVGRVAMLSRTEMGRTEMGAEWARKHKKLEIS
jgi:hypothetical protein